jgi:hypothetical protein
MRNADCGLRIEKRPSESERRGGSLAGLAKILVNTPEER